MKSKMFILILSVLLISLFSWNVFSENTDSRIGLYYRLSPKDDTVSIDVFIQSASNVTGCQVWLTYNPTVLDYVDEVFEEGGYFPANAFYGQRQLESLSDTETRLRFAVASAPIENKNSGIIATLTFKVLNVEKHLPLSLVDGNLNKGTGTLFSDATGSLSLPGVVELDDHSNILAGATPIDINLGQATISSLHLRSGKIDYESDVDYFKIEVISPGALTVYSEKSSIDLVGQLFDSKGSHLVSSSVNETVGINNSKDQNFRIVHRVTNATLSTPKTYYVKVIASHNDSTGDYRFYAKFTPNESPDLVVESISGSGPGLKIPENLITDVAFTPNHTYFVLHPQFVSANSPMDDYLRQQCTITLHLGGQHLNDTLDYYTLPLPPKPSDSITEQVSDEVASLVLQELIGKVPLVSINDEKKLSLGDVLKIVKIVFGFRNISDPDEDPRATITYYPNSESTVSYGGNVYPILFMIRNKRLSSVGFEVEQVYYEKGSWIPIQLDFTEEESSDTFNFVPLLGGALNFVKNVFVTGIETAFNTIGNIAEFINNQVFVLLMNAPDQYGHFTVEQTGKWNLEATFREENPGLAAPRAQPISLGDYPPFQQLPPEVQEYLLQHFEGTANLKATNAEMWQVPEETSLLANFPNPFNPETWIPYQLAQPADVSLTIYDIQGRVVRDLDLGHQRAGMYHSRSRAAYWDGRNAVGEPVATGVYFYTLTAGDFTATRKLLIRK